MQTHHYSRTGAQPHGCPHASRNAVPFITMRLAIRFTVLLLIAMATGCVATQSSDDRVLSPDGDFFLKKMELDNARFEPFQSQPFHPFLGRYWIRKGDSVALRWDTWEFQWQNVGIQTTCAFADNHSSTDCQICEACIVDREGRDLRGMPCFGAQPVLDFPGSIVSLKGFFHDAMPVPIGGLSGLDFLRGCAHNNTPVTFEPDSDAVYQLRLPLKFPLNTADKVVVTEKEIHVLAPQTSVKTAYQLNSTVVDGTQYWTWSTKSIPNANDADAFWIENFSPNLHVSEVRIYKGTCQYDPNTGICERFLESRRVRPSRVLFIPNFTNSISSHPLEASHRCYQDPAMLDFLSLDNCRLQFSPNNIQTFPILTTPTFEPGREMEKTTWFVEFNTNEGGDADLGTPCNLMTGVGCDALGANERLIIEFTIAAS